MKYFIVNNKEYEMSIINFLIDKIGLPSIQRRLNIYSSCDDFQVEIINSRIYFRNSSQDKKNIVENKNLKSFFRFLDKKYVNGFYINDILLLDFGCVKYLFNTYHGDILSFYDETIATKFSKKFDFPSYDDINYHKMVVDPKSERLFDEVGNLNSKIKSYASKTGLDVRSVSSSIRTRISNLSNDYSHFECYFNKITHQNLLGFKSEINHEKKFKEMSIIIPAFNTNVVPTLLSIQGQNLSKESKKKVQVILVDDGSDEPTINSLNSLKNVLDYDLDIITLSKNMGLSNARNLGFSIAKNNLILFMDSDIVLSKNYLYDVNIRLQVIPNAIFVAMRKNISKTSKMLLKKNLLAGVDNCYDFDDSRVRTVSKEYHIGWEKSYKNSIINVLDDTDNFKNLGFGAKIGIYSLPTVVTGHNIAINRSMIKKQPLFSTKFIGWGLEDSYFAATLISNGCFVIPVLSSCVYHIDHPPRSGSMKKKREEADNNYRLYNEMLDDIWEE